MFFLPSPKRAKRKLLKEFEGMRILELGHRKKHPSQETPEFEEMHFGTKHNLKHFPWPVEDDTYDLVICQQIMEHLPDTAKTMEELSRITTHGGKIFIETPHYTWFETYRHVEPIHRFSFGSFDYFLKGNSHYETPFHMEDKKLFFDDLTSLMGVGFLANKFPHLYERRLAFIFPATSFHITFLVDKSEETVQTHRASHKALD